MNDFDHYYEETHRLTAEVATVRADLTTLRAELAQANHWRHSYADAVKAAEAEITTLRAELAAARADAADADLPAHNDFMEASAKLAAAYAELREAKRDAEIAKSERNGERVKTTRALVRVAKLGGLLRECHGYLPRHYNGGTAGLVTDIAERVDAALKDTPTT